MIRMRACVRGEGLYDAKEPFWCLFVFRLCIGSLFLFVMCIRKSMVVVCAYKCVYEFVLLSDFVYTLFCIFILVFMCKRVRAYHSIVLTFRAFQVWFLDLADLSSVRRFARRYEGDDDHDCDAL